MSRNRLFLLPLAALFAVTCSEQPSPPPGNESMSKILTEMIDANQARLSPDSLAVRRQAIFDRHTTSEVEVRAWIEAARTNPALSQAVAQRAATLLDSTSSTPYKK